MDHQPFEVDKISNPDTLHYVKFLPKFTPVIHIKSESHAVEQAQVAFDSGANGIFLIEHARSNRHLKRAYEAVRQKFTTQWIGLNFLDLHSELACEHVPVGADALWIDDGMINESGSLSSASKLSIIAIKYGAGINWKLFGGTAFKYQAPVKSYAAVAKIASDLFDVVCTSGSGTGSAPDVEKIKEMKENCGDTPLAVASGITPENVDQFLPYVDCFMVSTGISKSFHDLDPVKTYQLATLINA
jgi:hypothetical protein